MNVASWSVIDMARAVREGSREGCWGGVVVAMPGGVGCLGQIRKEGRRRHPNKPIVLRSTKNRTACRGRGVDGRGVDGGGGKVRVRWKGVKIWTRSTGGWRSIGVAGLPSGSGRAMYVWLLNLRCDLIRVRKMFFC